MAVNRIQVGGSAPSPDRQDFNLVAGSGITLTASDDATNSVSKATVAMSSLSGFSCFWTGNVGIALATAGNDTANTNGDLYWAPIFVTNPCTITGLAYLIGSIGGTDKAILALYSSAGVLLASSALAGTTVGTAANFQNLDFVTPYVAAPGVYFAALQCNGTTAKFRSHTAPGLKFVTGTVAGTFGTLPAITPGTTYTANKGPIVVSY